MENPDYLHDIIKGLCSGIFGGIGLASIKLLYDRYLHKRDENRIVDFFYKENIGKGFEFRSTEVISSFTNLPEDRVNYVCSKSKKITRNTKEKLSWKLV